MNRSEFLNQLREALVNDLDASAVQENIDYYSNYIAEEMRNGKVEAEVLEMLGDPWVIARNIIDSPSGSHRYGNSSYTYEPAGERQHEQQRDRQPYYQFGIDTWWKKLLLVLMAVGIIVIVFAIITGLLSLLLPIIVPLLIIAFIVRLLTR